MDVKKIEKKLNVSFINHNLLKQAFTHSSYVNEHRKESYLDNERLEFLGDAVLELAVSEYLYKENQEMPEGEMTKQRASIVCEASLAHFARTLQFNDYLLLGKGEEQTGGRNRPSLLADVFEAFLGALFLDQGYDQAISFLDKQVFPTITIGAFSHGMDYKSQLQELIQQDKHVSIDYKIIDEKGPSHNKEFIAQVQLSDEIYKGDIGRTKKEAEQRAAKHALDTLSKS